MFSFESSIEQFSLGLQAWEELHRSEKIATIQFSNILNDF